MGGNRINPEVSIEKWYNHVECVKKNTMLTSCKFYYTTGIKAFALHLSFCIFWMFWSCIMLISLSCFSNMIKIFLLCSRFMRSCFSDDMIKLMREFCYLYYWMLICIIVLLYFVLFLRKCDLCWLFQWRELCWHWR